MGGGDRTQRLVDGLGLFSLGLGTAQLIAPNAMNRLIGADDDAKNRAMHRWLGGAREFTAGVGIKSRRKPTRWMWARVAGDMVDLGALGAVLGSPRRRPDARRRAAIAMAAVAVVTVADLVAAVRMSRLPHSAQNGRTGQVEGEIKARGRITVNRPVGEVFAYWRQLENLPAFMAHVQSVRSLGAGRSRWQAAGPAGTEIEWDAEITEERTDEFIAWRSVGDATVTNSGAVEFRPAPGGRGTEVRVQLTYDPPAGKPGAAIAKLWGEAPDQQIRDDLRRFKQVLETGEVVRSEGSPQGTTTRQQIAQRPAQPLPT